MLSFSFFFFNDLHLKIIQAFPPYFTGSSLAFANKAESLNA